MDANNNYDRPSGWKHPPATPESRRRKYAYAREMLYIVPEGEPATPAERGLSECPCTAMKCPLRNKCHLCYANHVGHGGLPKCLRTDTDAHTPEGV